MADGFRSLSAAALSAESTLNQLDEFTQLGTTTMQQFSDFVVEADLLILRLGRIIALLELLLLPADIALRGLDRAMRARPRRPHGCIPTRCRLLSYTV